MESKPAQNIQDSFLNNARKDKIVLTIYLMSGVKLSGRIKSFDKYSLVLETNNQEQLIFKHAVSTVVTQKAPHSVARHCPDGRGRRGSAGVPGPPVHAGRPGGIAHGTPHRGSRTGHPGRAGLESPRPLRAQSAVPVEESLDELAELAASAGARVVERLVQSRPAPDAATLVGQGKVEELAGAVRMRAASTW